MTIIIPSELLTDFQDFLRSTLSISQYVKTQARVKKAIQKARDLSYQEEQQKQFEKYSSSILSKFDSFVKSGRSTREAIRETKAFFNKKEKYLTCYTIELIVRDAGRLSKRQRKD